MKPLLCGRCEAPWKRTRGALACTCDGIPETGPGAGSRASDYAATGLRLALPECRPPARRTDTSVPRPPIEWTGTEPPFLIPEWGPLGASTLPVQAASRHTLVLGETGSGKSKSAVIPFTLAALRYPETGTALSSLHELRPSMLIIDPKRELLDAVRSENEKRDLQREITHLEPGVGEWHVSLFEGLEPLDLSGEEVVGRILAVSGAYAYQRANTREAYFPLQAEYALEALFDVDLALYRIGGEGWVRAFWEELRDQLLEEEKARLDIGNFLLRPLALLSLAARASAWSAPLDRHSAVAEAYGVDEAIRSASATVGHLPHDTFGSVVSTALGMTKDVANAQFLRHVHVDPFSPGGAEQCFSVRDAMSRGACTVYTPVGRSAAGKAIGRALKSRFFDETFSREDRIRPFVYICDEAQNFLTSDPVSGEQSYLDRARAFRASCLLATQSLASLRHALTEDPLSGRSEAALDILLTNTATKLTFRATDAQTREQLHRLLPGSPVLDGPHIIDTRPPASLGVGECYFLRAVDGGWGRAQIKLTE